MGSSDSCCCNCSGKAGYYFDAGYLSNSFINVTKRWKQGVKVDAFMDSVTVECVLDEAFIRYFNQSLVHRFGQ